LELTEAGVGFIAASRRILEDVGEAERQASGEYHAPRGRLQSTAPLSFGRHHVLPLVSDYLAQYPDVAVRLILTDQYLDLI
ncbi:LysR family transcriptional regulator, partial [Acinetobacter baumannii]